MKFILISAESGPACVCVCLCARDRVEIAFSAKSTTKLAERLTHVDKNDRTDCVYSVTKRKLIHVHSKAAICTWVHFIPFGFGLVAFPLGSKRLRWSIIDPISLHIQRFDLPSAANIQMKILQYLRNINNNSINWNVWNVSYSGSTILPHIYKLIPRKTREQREWKFPKKKFEFHLRNFGFIEKNSFWSIKFCVCLNLFQVIYFTKEDWRHRINFFFPSAALMWLFELSRNEKKGLFVQWKQRLGDEEKEVEK